MPMLEDPQLRSPAVAASSTVLLAAQARALRMIEEGAPLRDILSRLATTVETLSEGRSVASILLLDREGLLRNGASPNLSADYLDAIDRLKPDADVGTCAAAAATGEVVMTPDFHADRRWAQLRHWPLALGFQGAWSMPIKASNGEVLGTFGTYFRQSRLPTAEEVAVVRQLVGIAALAIGTRNEDKRRQEETNHAHHQGIPPARRRGDGPDHHLQRGAGARAPE